MFESWPFATWPWPDLCLALSHGHFSALLWLSKDRPEKNIYNDLFGLISAIVKSVIFDLWPQFDLPRDLDLKKLHALQSSRQGLSNAVCRLSLRCVVLEISWGGQNAPPTGRVARQTPTVRKLKLIKKYIFSEGEQFYLIDLGFTEKTICY